jgi:hypothetical protein
MERRDAAMVQILRDQGSLTGWVSLEFPVGEELPARNHAQRLDRGRRPDHRVRLGPGVMPQTELDAGRVVTGEPDVDGLLEILGRDERDGRLADCTADPLEQTRPRRWLHSDLVNQVGEIAYHAFVRHGSLAALVSKRGPMKKNPTFTISATKQLSRLFLSYCKLNHSPTRDKFWFNTAARIRPHLDGLGPLRAGTGHTAVSQ